MAAWKEILRRGAYLGRRSKFDRELDDEIRFHIETRAEELRGDGVPPAEALERARREFGPRARMSEDSRDAWAFRWLEDLWRDVRYGVRAAAQSKAFTAIAVISLALGVGANCAMFIFVDGLMLRPLAVPRPNEIVTVYETSKSGTTGASYREYRALRERMKSLAALTAMAPVSIGFATQSGAVPHSRDGQMVAANYFDVLGVEPERGRGFSPEEDQAPGRDAVVILSHGLWEREFGSEPAVLGKQAWIGGSGYTIIGVLPAQFAAVDEDLMEDYPEYYVPLAMAPRLGSDPEILEKPEIRGLTLVGRMRRGVTIPQAQAELSTLAAGLAEQYPDTNRGRNLAVLTIRRYRTSAGGGAGIGVMSLAGAVLLVACFNVAGLLTSRSAGRAKEIALRLAIGAGRARLIRQLLTESLLLAAAGGAAGLAIGYIPLVMVRRMVREFDPNMGPIFDTFLRLDSRVVMFNAGVALLSVLLFGLVPAWQTTRADLTAALKGAGTAPRRRGFLRRLWGRNVLVTGQVAISVLLLTVSSITYVGVGRILAAVGDSGFATERVVVAMFDPLLKHYNEAKAKQFYAALLERLRGSGGVASATLASGPESTVFRPEGYDGWASTNGGEKGDPVVNAIWAETGFFDALSIPMLRGRGFLSTDVAGARAVAVVNEAFVKLYLPGQDAIGKRIRIGGDAATRGLQRGRPMGDLGDGTRWVEVVGVAGIKTYQQMIQIPPPPLLFFPVAQNPKHPMMILFAKPAGDLETLTGAVRTSVRELDPAQAVPDMRRWQEVYEAIAKAGRLVTEVVGAMGAIGIGLALVGLYGLVSYDVNTRTREIGIRMALGAKRGAVLRMVLRQGAMLAVCGIACGLLLNYGVGMALKAALALPPGPGENIDLGYRSIAVFVLAVLALMIAATYIPARRAARVDPSEALRCE